jgi:hypothetical protein
MSYGYRTYRQPNRKVMFAVASGPSDARGPQRLWPASTRLIKSGYQDLLVPKHKITDLWAERRSPSSHASKAARPDKTIGPARPA